MSIATPEGRINSNGYTSYVQEYTITDNQGNVRITFDKGANNAAHILNERHYYPSGLDFLRRNNSAVNHFGFGGKEEYEDPLGWLDFHARMYDPTIARWHAPDLLAEKYFNTSPYVYCLGNPVNFTDPTGMETLEGDAAREFFQKLKDGGKYSAEAAFNLFNNIGAQYGFGQGDNYTAFEVYPGTGIMGYKMGNKIIVPYGTYCKTKDANGAYTISGLTIEGWNIYEITDESNSEGGNGALDYAGALVGAADTYFSTMGEGFHNNLYWIQKNGVLRSTNYLSNTNKIYQTSYNIVGSTLKTTKLIGKSFSITGTVISTAQFALDPNLGNAIDAGMGATTFIPGVGWAISGIYFVGNIASEVTTGRTLGTNVVEGARYNPMNPIYPLVVLFGH